MNRGYVKLWRKAFDNGLHRNHKAWALFTWIIGNVTHKEIDYIAGNQKIRLRAGQIVTGRKRLAEEMAMSVQNIRTCLELLKNIGFLTIKPTNKYSVLTVVNWASYQSDDCKVTNKPTGNQPATNQQLTTKQEQKNKRRYIKTTAPVGADIFKNQNAIDPVFLETIKDRCAMIEKLPPKNRSRFNPYQFAQDCVNKSYHPQAIIDSLDGLIKFWDSTNNPWAYGSKIVLINSQNYSERSHQAETEKFKNLWDANPAILSLVRGIGNIND